MTLYSPLFRSLRPGIVLVGALLLASAAAAQTGSSNAIDDVRKGARLHLGALYVTPSLRLKELGVDTNVFNQAGERKSDLFFNLAPAADLWIPVVRRALLKATVASDLVWYARYASERSVDPQASVRAEVYLHRVTLFAEDSYLNTRQRPNFEIDARSRHVENNATGGIGYRLTPKLSLELAGGRGRVEYEADAYFLGSSLRETLNRSTTSASITMRQRVTALTTIAVRVEGLTDRFTYAGQRDTDSVRVMPGVEFKPRALISGSAWAGFRRFSPRHEDVLSPYSGLVAQLGLSYTLLGATTFGVTYNRDVSYSFEEVEPYYVSNQIGASIRRAVGSHFDVLVSADRYLYEYSHMRGGNGSDLGVPLQSRQDVTWSYGGTFGYRLGGTGRVGFGATYYDRTSNTKAYRDYHVLRIITSVSYGL